MSDALEALDRIQSGHAERWKRDYDIATIRAVLIVATSPAEPCCYARYGPEGREDCPRHREHKVSP